jgi:hypothetical protein
MWDSAADAGDTPAIHALRTHAMPRSGCWPFEKLSVLYVLSIHQHSRNLNCRCSHRACHSPVTTEVHIMREATRPPS